MLGRDYATTKTWGKAGKLPYDNGKIIMSLVILPRFSGTIAECILKTQKNPAMDKNSVSYLSLPCYLSMGDQVLSGASLSASKCQTGK